MANRKVENWLSKLYKSPIIYRSKDHNKRVKVDGRYMTPKPYFVLFKNGDIIEVTPKTAYKIAIKDKKTGKTHTMDRYVRGISVPTHRVSFLSSNGKRHFLAKEKQVREFLKEAQLYFNRKVDNANKK